MAPVPPPGRRSPRPSDRLKALRKPMKRVAGGADQLRVPAEDDGLAVSDEALLLILSRLSGDTADLVNCAATCRRWRRLVSNDAAFICRSNDNKPIRFFQHSKIVTTTASRVPRFLRVDPASLPGLVDGTGHWALNNASARVVASRDGHLVVEVRRGENLTLCVCNPMTGQAVALPPLRGNDDSPSSRAGYSCALLRAEDLHHCNNNNNATAWSSCTTAGALRRRGASPLTRAPGDASRGPGRTNRQGGKAATRPTTYDAIVHRGVVYWPRLNLALMLSLPTATASSVVEGMPTPLHYGRETKTSLLGLCSRTGALCWVEVIDDGRKIRFRYRNHAGDMFCVRDGTLKGQWLPPMATVDLARVMPELLVGSVALRRFCDKGRTVFFTAKTTDAEDEECWYALDLGTEEVKDVWSTDDGCCDLSGAVSTHALNSKKWHQSFLFLLLS
ncbi:hypothetical protein QOZ80_6AG0524120 [Eleusine coracana subsp. coracana]|nr:hypothetical protein QOZ80_6AG0524120 [Eleusine coracana subsp. coracana]